MSGYRRPADDEGSLAVMVAIMGLSFFALAGLVIDGARDLRARSHVLAYAQEAARAGADAGILRTSAELALDPAAVEAAAERYCRAANVSLASDGTASAVRLRIPRQPDQQRQRGLRERDPVDEHDHRSARHRRDRYALGHRERKSRGTAGLTARDAVAPAGGCP